MLLNKNQIFAPRQRQFIAESKAKFNLAHGSVRSGKTVCTLWRFMEAVHNCPGNSIWMIGLSSDTIYDNVIRLLFESEELGFFKQFCNWSPGKRELTFLNKTISTLGAKDERAIGPIQGKTFDLCYCDEMTLYPHNVSQMISTRLSKEHSMLFASMNPMHPSHIIKEWIDAGVNGDPNFYSLHFGIDDNPFLPASYKKMLQTTLSGLFYRRNYLGEWCLAEGAIFDFLDKKIHVVKRPPRAAEFWIVGVDYGTSNPFAAVLVGYSSGRHDGTGVHMWVEKEYYYDPKKMGRQKTNSEFARDLQVFLDGYSVRSIYLDPSAESFQVELRRLNMHIVHANNDVYNGIQVMTTMIKEGTVTICEACPNLIREMEGYVWDPRAAKNGDDEPLKQNDHACVVGDTKILCSNKEGERVIKICDLTSVMYLGNVNKFKVKNLNIDGLQTEDDEIIRCEMTSRYEEIYQLRLKNKKKLFATCDHEIYTQRGFVRMDDLTLKDQVAVYEREGRGPKRKIVFVPIYFIRKELGCREVYCLSASKNRTMICNDIITHNCDALRYALFSFVGLKKNIQVSDPDAIYRKQQQQMQQKFWPQGNGFQKWG